MADPENIGIAVVITFLLSVETEIIVYRIHFRLKAAISNLPLPFIRESVQENIVEFAI